MRGQNTLASDGGHHFSASRETNTDEISLMASLIYWPSRTALRETNKKLNKNLKPCSAPPSPGISQRSRFRSTTRRVTVKKPWGRLPRHQDNR